MSRTTLEQARRNAALVWRTAMQTRGRARAALRRSARALTAATVLAFAPMTSDAAPDLQVLGDPFAPVVAAQPDLIRTGPATYRFEMTLSQAVQFAPFVLTGPDRLVVDLPEIDWGFGPTGATARLAERAEHVRRIRTGLFRPGRSRLVIDLARPVTVISGDVMGAQPNQPARLVIDFELGVAASAGPEDAAPSLAAPSLAAPSLAAPSLAAPSRAAPSRAAPSRAALPPPPRRAAATNRIAPARPASRRPAPPPRRPQRLVVMLDPGHGGKDPGAIAGGVQEKDITLDFARRLRSRLRQGGRFDVRMTRSSDVFIPLRKRVEKARAARADLFISIHADAAPNHPRLSGASVYTLSDKASDRLADQLARGHSGGAALPGTDLPERSAIREIIVDYTKRRVNDRSEDFAEIVVSELGRRDVPVLKKRPHRQAAFVVLKSFSAPGALVELGFLTNILDRRRLTNPAWRDEAAEAIARAVRRWADPTAEPVRLKATDR